MENANIYYYIWNGVKLAWYGTDYWAKCLWSCSEDSGARVQQLNNQRDAVSRHSSVTSYRPPTSPHQNHAQYHRSPIRVLTRPDVDQPEWSIPVLIRGFCRGERRPSAGTPPPHSQPLTSRGHVAVAEFCGPPWASAFLQADRTPYRSSPTATYGHRLTTG